MPKDTLNKIVENLSKLSVSEAAELSKLLEEKWGVEANAPIVAVAPQSSANGESQDEVGDGGVVNIELIATGDKKIDVILEYISSNDFAQIFISDSIKERLNKIKKIEKEVKIIELDNRKLNE